MLQALVEEAGEAGVAGQTEIEIEIETKTESRAMPVLRLRRRFQLLLVAKARRRGHHLVGLVGQQGLLAAVTLVDALPLPLPLPQAHEVLERRSRLQLAKVCRCPSPQVLSSCLQSQAVVVVAEGKLAGLLRRRV